MKARALLILLWTIAAGVFALWITAPDSRDALDRASGPHLEKTRYERRVERGGPVPRAYFERGRRARRAVVGKHFPHPRRFHFWPYDDMRTHDTAWLFWFRVGELNLLGLLRGADFARISCDLRRALLGVVSQSTPEPYATPRAL